MIRSEIDPLRLVALEAGDGVGKTGTLQKLEEAGARVVTTPSPNWTPMRRRIETAYQRGDIGLGVRFIFYLSGVAAVSSRLKREEGIVFADRYLLSTLAGHEAMGMNRDTLLALAPLYRAILPPSEIVILECEESERRRRLGERGMSEVDRRNNELNDRITHGFGVWADTLGYPITRVDTTHLPIASVASTISSRYGIHR